MSEPVFVATEYDGSRWVQEDDYLAVLAVLKEGIAGINRADAECPPTAFNERCPKCGANKGQNCGPWVTAAGRLVTLAQGALRRMTAENPAMGHGSPELDEDAAKLAALGQDAGLTLDDIA